MFSRTDVVFYSKLQVSLEFLARLTARHLIILRTTRSKDIFQKRAVALVQSRRDAPYQTSRKIRAKSGRGSTPNNTGISLESWIQQQWGHKKCVPGLGKVLLQEVVALGSRLTTNAAGSKRKEENDSQPIQPAHWNMPTTSSLSCDDSLPGLCFPRRGAALTTDGSKRQEVTLV